MKAKTSAQARTAAAQSKAAQRRVTKDFASLRNRLKRLTQRYSAPSANLHFDQLTHGDADVYPSILELAEQGFRSVRQHDEFFSRHSLYGDGMFWYGLFLFISVAARRVQTDRAQAYIPATTVDRLIDILVRMTPYSHVNGGDITKRNDEALGNTLLAFYDDKRIRTVRVLGRKNGISVDWILKRVNEVRSEARQLTADQPAGTEPYAEVWIPAEPEILVLYNPVERTLYERGEPSKYDPWKWPMNLRVGRNDRDCFPEVAVRAFFEREGYVVLVSEPKYPDGLGFILFHYRQKRRDGDPAFRRMQAHFPDVDLNEIAELARDAKREIGRTGGGGDPDLFVFRPNTGERFFVEVKDKDQLHPNQHLCFQVIERHLRCPVRIARIVPKK